MIKKIAIYGKGGIGKSTTVANLSAVYANNDLNCLVIGCDPKADTTRTLCGRRIPTVVDTLKNNRKPSEEDIIVKDTMIFYVLKVEVLNLVLAVPDAV